MKKLVLTLAAVLGLFAMTACSSSKPESKPEDVVLDVNAVAEEIMTAGGMEVRNAVDAATIGLDESMVKSFVAFKGGEDDANRVYLFELADAQYLDAVKHVGELDQDALINGLVNVGGDAFEVAKASRIMAKGNYVLYLSVPNFEEAKAVFMGKFE